MVQLRGNGPPVDASKMDKRFSTLFLEVPHLGHDKVAGNEASPSKIKRMLGRLFNKTPSRSTTKAPPKSTSVIENNSEDIWNTVIRLTKSPSKAKRSSGLSKGQGTSSSTTKSQPQSNNSITVHPPHIDVLPSHIRNDIFYKGKGKPVASSRDSKFSSISSLPSLHSLAISTGTPLTSAGSSAITFQSTHLSLSRLEFRHLQSFTRRATRRLQQQEHLISNLSNNLLHILAKKETQLQNQKRARKQDQAEKLGTIFRLHEQCGRLFMRKSATLQHSLTMLGALKAILEDANMEAALAIPEVCSSRTAAEGVRFVVGREGLVAFCKEVRKDIEVQRNLDKEVQKIVFEKAREARWVVSVGEGIMMVRFVGFLDGRGKMLESCYEKLGDVVKGIEGVAMEKEAGLF